MHFEKGNKFGFRFTVDNQPTPEAKSAGRRKRKMLRDAMRALLESVEPDDEAAAAVMRLLPKKRRDRVTTWDTLCLRQVMDAKDGSVKAFQNVMKVADERPDEGDDA